MRFKVVALHSITKDNWGDGVLYSKEQLAKYGHHLSFKPLTLNHYDEINIMDHPPYHPRPDKINFIDPDHTLKAWNLDYPANRVEEIKYNPTTDALEGEITVTDPEILRMIQSEEIRYVSVENTRHPRDGSIEWKKLSLLTNDIPPRDPKARIILENVRDTSRDCITEISSSFTKDHIYIRNSENTAWLESVLRTNTQTLTNKTINLTNNTIEDTSDAQGDIIAHNGTKFVRKAMGSAYHHLRVNSGATDIEYAEGFEKLGSTTASGGETSLSVASLTAKKKLIVYVWTKPQTSSMDIGIRFNNDSGSNYYWHIQELNGTTATYGEGASDGEFRIDEGTSISSGATEYTVLEIANHASGSYKNIIGRADIQYNDSAAASTLTYHGGGKWTNNSAQITRVDVVRIGGTGTFASGSVIEVWGSD